MKLDKKTRLTAFWCILAVLIIARLYQFGIVPGDINQDEAFAGYNAYTLLHTGRDSFGYSMPMYLTAWGSGMNALESYLMIPFVAVFGLHTCVIRLVPLILSILSLVTVYKIFHDFTKNDILGLFSMFFMGVMPWHILISRWALESNLAPAMLLFGCYFFLKGLHHEKYYIFSAVCYGLSLYSYATIWVVVPFIVLSEIIYLIIKKRIHITKYTVSAAITLFVLALPAILFLLVNMGYINEIKTPIFSIPRMVGFRGSEISLSNIQENLNNLFNIITTQSDGLIWNSFGDFGLIYKISLPFTLVGLIAVIRSIYLKRKSAKENGKKTKVQLSFFLIVHLIAGLVIGALIGVNINRVNIIWIPIILMTAYGWYAIFYNIEWIKSRLVWLPIALYLFCFVRFEIYYFDDYKSQIGEVFCEGVENAMEFVCEDLKDNDFVRITPGINYARVLYYTKEDLDEYLDTVEYTNYPSAFLDVASFGRYSFDTNADSIADGTSVYVLDETYEGTNLLNSIIEQGYECYKSGRFAVYYK